jgi:hypothetical protein
MRLIDHTGMPQADHVALERRLDGLGMLGDLVRWLPQQSTAAALLDVIVQDEFTHDVIVSDSPRYLVFDTT